MHTTIRVKVDLFYKYLGILLEDVKPLKDPGYQFSGECNAYSSD